ncbi:MAG: S41 family peptidase [Pseudomonadota bacterium]
MSCSKNTLVRWRRCVGPTALIVALTACGGGGGGSSPASFQPQTPPPPPATPSGSSDFANGVFQPEGNFKDLCANPRVGNFPDSAGSTTDENLWLRSWSNNTYLWFDEIEDADPAAFATPAYFDLMRTFATTASGAQRDRFHFTFDTEDWIALNQSGISAGYGFELSILARTPPREAVVAFSEPGSPAAAADVARGARILRVDGVDFVNGGSQADVDTINAGLFPGDINEAHSITFLDLGANEERTVTLTSQEIVVEPVPTVEVLATDSGDVGYLVFNTHIAPSEQALFDAFSSLSEAGVSELVLDLRYNGGGLLTISNQVAYMIAGPAAASGRVYGELEFNSKHTVRNPVTGALLQPEFFQETTVGFSATEGQPLPTLNLDRVFVLSGPDTCSASEAIINGLRGIDVEVVLIGETTCGKPYGFYPTDNCGTTYFTVQFRGINAVGFGDYGDGFSPANLPTVEGVPLPGCAVGDDFSKQLGDVAEARLAAALSYMETGECPAASDSTSRLQQARKRPAGAEPGLAVAVPPRIPGSVLLR